MCYRRRTDEDEDEDEDEHMDDDLGNVLQKLHQDEMGMSLDDLTSFYGM